MKTGNGRKEWARGRKRQPKKGLDKKKKSFK
jgi:hypothetical protein